MAWDFETDPEFQTELDWMDEFVRDEVEPLDFVLDDPYDKSDERAMEILRPLQAQVKARGLWACHLGPELGGPGYGQVKLALMNQILGRSGFAPTVFGCQAPDSGNAEILAHFGTQPQKDRFLQPLLDGEIGHDRDWTGRPLPRRGGRHVRRCLLSHRCGRSPRPAGRGTRSPPPTTGRGSRAGGCGRRHP